MTPFLGLLILLLITFIGVRFFGRSAIIKTPLLSGLLVSGFPYVLTGVLLGPKFFNFLNNEIINSLEPLLSLAIGWVGFIFGIQLKWRNIRRFPVNYTLFTTIQSLITFGVIALAAGATLFYLEIPNLHNIVEGVIIIAAIGSMTAPLSIVRLIIEKRIKGRLTNLIQYISSLDSFWGIVIAGTTIAIFHPPSLRWFYAGWHWIIIGMSVSILLGFLFHFLLRFRFNQEEIFLLVIGLVIFTSGIGFYLRLSPIFLTMILGITIAQFHRTTDKVSRVIHIGEKPTYLFLLVFAGALWNYRLKEEIILIVIFLLARFIGKYIGGFICAKKINCSFPVPLNIGKGLLSFGGIALAIAFNFQLFYGGLIGDFLMSATILGMLIFDEYTAISIMNILKRSGEIY